MKKLLLLVLASSSLCAMNSGTLTIKKSDIFASQALGKVRVLRDNDGFKVRQNGTVHEVQSCDVDKNLRGMSNDQLSRLLKQRNALIKVNKLSNGDFTVGLDGKLKGGGYFSGVAAAWVVRTLGYGAVATAAATATVQVAAMAGPTTAAIGLKMAGAAGAQAMGLTAGGKVLAVGVMQTKAAGDVALAVAAVGPQVVAVVEGAALTAQVAVTLIPWLP